MIVVLILESSRLGSWLGRRAGGKYSLHTVPRIGCSSSSIHMTGCTSGLKRKFSFCVFAKIYFSLFAKICSGKLTKIMKLFVTVFTKIKKTNKLLP